MIGFAYVKNASAHAENTQRHLCAVTHVFRIQNRAWIKNLLIDSWINPCWNCNSVDAFWMLVYDVCRCHCLLTFTTFMYMLMVFRKICATRSCVKRNWCAPHSSAYVRHVNARVATMNLIGLNPDMYSFAIQGLHTRQCTPNGRETKKKP